MAGRWAPTPITTSTSSLETPARASCSTTGPISPAVGVARVASEVMTTTLRRPRASSCSGGAPVGLAKAGGRAAERPMGGGSLGASWITSCRRSSGDSASRAKRASRSASSSIAVTPGSAAWFVVGSPCSGLSISREWRRSNRCVAALTNVSVVWRGDRAVVDRLAVVALDLRMAFALDWARHHEGFEALGRRSLQRSRRRGRRPGHRRVHRRQRLAGRLEVSSGCGRDFAVAGAIMRAASRIARL